MDKSTAVVQKWDRAEPPSEAAVRRLLAAEGLQAYLWSNEPHDFYPAHSHKYHKVIYVVKGSIWFGLVDDGKQLKLTAGDRLELPAGIVHDAVVGPEGVVCLEGHRS